MAVFRVPQLNLQRLRGLIIFVAMIALLSASSQLIHFLVDWFWFQEVGYE